MPSKHPTPRIQAIGLALLIGGTAPAQAQDALDVPADAELVPVPRVELQVSGMPRLASVNGELQSQRRMGLLWLPASPALGSSLGLAAGMANGQNEAGSLAATPATAFDLGVLWRHNFSNQQRIDVTAWHRLNPPSDAIALIAMREPTYGARVEMKLAPSRGFIAENRSLGMQLDHGAKISLRKRDGGAALFFKAQF